MEVRNARPGKISLDFLKKFEPKAKQEERKNDEPKKPTQIKKINANKLFQKINNDRNTQNNQNFNTITKNANSNTVSNALNIINKGLKESKEKEMREKAEKEEKERKRAITIQMTRQKQQAQLKEKKALKEEKDKKNLEEKKAKEKREKEFKEKNEKVRNFLFVQNNLKNWKNEAKEELRKMNSSQCIKFIGLKNVNICMDLSTRLANFFIYGYEDNVIKYQFPNCLSYQKMNNRYNFNFFGDEMNKGFSTEINYLVNEGNINDFELAELLLNYIIGQKMHFDSFENCKILFTEPIKFAENERKKIKEIVFETFGIKKLLFVKPSILTLLSEGKYTGIVAELDYDISNFIPISNCTPLDNGIIKSNLGRRDILDYMKFLLTQQYPNYRNIFKDQTIQSIVTESCFAALNYDKEKYNVNKYNYTLPDNSTISITTPRITCPEILFEPKLYYKYDNGQTPGIISNLYDSITKCNPELQSILYNNIVLTGCNSKISRLEERIEKDLKTKAGYIYNDNIKICSNNGIENGALNFFNTSNFQNMWYTQNQYEEGINFGGISNNYYYV